MKLGRDGNSVEITRADDTDLKFLLKDDSHYIEMTCLINAAWLLQAINDLGFTRGNSDG